ncbi:MAG TPA: hypothetical protein VLB27_04005, partial [candidate division Zixibacteria bacterium]|nr:hypothetical protein [candidate division Zixibacteria bacterium]
MMELRAKTWALVAGCVAAVIVYSYAVALPLERRHTAALRSIDELTLKTGEYQEALRTLGERLVSRDSLEMVRQRLHEQLYSQADALELIADIERLAQSRHLTVKEITPSISELLALLKPADSDEALRRLSISVRVAGSLNDAGEFLRDLESAPFYRGLKSLQAL